MKNISAIIVDDEIALSQYLQSMLQQLWPELDIIGIARNGSEALNLIRSEEPDIAFLDIKMPVLSGLQVAEYAKGLCHVVFITAYDEYAIEAFKHAAVDYLLKPVEEARLRETINRLQVNLPNKITNGDSWSELIEKLSHRVRHGEAQGYLRWIRAGEGDETRLISVDDICYFQAEDKYTSVVTTEKPFLIRKSIKELALELDPELFWQIHRGIIVKTSSIASTRKDINGRLKVYLKDHTDVLLASRRYSHIFKQM